MEISELKELLEFLKSLDLEIVKTLFATLVTFMGTCRFWLKPITSLWIKYVSPWIRIERTNKLLKHPLYKSLTYLLDYLTSAKAPQEEIKKKVKL